MARYSIVLVLFIFWSCTSQSQSINKEIVKEGKKPYLLGKIDKDGLISKNYVSWFQNGFDQYEPNPEIIKKITKELKDYKIVVFMGTWCGDSRREVPHFYKVLETANFPLDQLTMVAVSSEPNLYKQSPDHEEDGLNIHRVPTFIFYKKGKEVNRIVEQPLSTLEEDIFSIINNNYTPNYHLVTRVYNLMKKSNYEEQLTRQLPNLKLLSKNMFELNTYGRLLSSKKKIKEAITVFKLNTKLFPNQPRTYMSLANTLGANGYKDSAIKVLEEALKMHPDNIKLKNNLTVIKSN